MRLNIESYRAILDAKQFSDEYVQKATGLSKKTYSWILNQGFIECETLKRIADAIDCVVADILSDDYDGYAENVIEWSKDQKRATLSLSQRRTITRIKELAKKYPEKCQILAENKDSRGRATLYAHIPTAWIRINPGKELSEEQRDVFAKRAEHARKNIRKTD